jgi:cyclopropane fatty-acyl-phospholipid synthase-like methyltransferase
MADHQNYWDSYFNGTDAETYDFSQSKPAAALVSFCDNYLKKKSTVLDLGCGGGRNAHYLAQRGYRVYGIDISAAAIEFCQKRFARFNLSGTFKQGTFSQIPFPDNYFAGLICVAALDHVTLETAKASIIEIRRVLARNGVMLMTFDPLHTDEDMLHEAEVLPDGTLRFVRGKHTGMLFHRYKNTEIKSLAGKENIITFNISEEGARIIICR